MPPRSPITVGIAVETTVASRAPIARARISPTTVSARLVLRGIGPGDVVQDPRAGNQARPRFAGRAVGHLCFSSRRAPRRARQKGKPLAVAGKQAGAVG